jgi:hypothetical protein
MTVKLLFEKYQIKKTKKKTLQFRKSQGFSLELECYDFADGMLKLKLPVWTEQN